MRFVLNSFLIFVLAAASISPACKIMGEGSGMSIFEICSSWGAETTKIPTPPIPFSLAAADEQPVEELPAGTMEQPPCMFCFAKDHIKQISADTVVLASVENIFTAPVMAASDSLIQKARRELYAPRGPPALSV